MPEKESLDKIRKEIEKLRQDIKYHDWRYYALSDPVISDAEYDGLMERLKKLERQYPRFITKDSPTQRVSGEVVEGFKVVVHKERMLSLENVYSEEEFMGWYSRIRKSLPEEDIEFGVDLKIDGVSASLTYQDGSLTLGATRGDGERGEEITFNIRTIRSIPLEFMGEVRPRSIEIRGEVYLDKNEFQKLNKARAQEGESVFANPRNAASGSLKLLDPSLVAKRRLKFFVHSLGNCAPPDFFKNHSDFLSRCKKWGLPVNPSYSVFNDIKEVINYYNHWIKYREKVSYEVDGMVVKVNSLRQQKKLGATMKSPRWAVAFKFPAHQVTTKVLKVIFGVGRTGVITPVAELEPVECGGVTISRSTLHNFDEVKRLDVRVGDTVLVERAGEVIPKVVKVIKEKRKGSIKKVAIPKKCPVCKGGIVKEKEEEVAYRCINPDCPAQLEKSLIHFASRSAMDIEGMGQSVVKELISKGMVKSLADIYSLEVEDFLKLPLFALKKSQNVYNAIQKSKSRPLARFLYALGIRHVGEKAAQVLAERFGTMDDIMKQDVDSFQAIPEIGPVVASSIVQFFRQPNIKSSMRRFREAGLNFKQGQREKVSNVLGGKTFVFTGEMESFSRQEARDLVVRLGGDVSSSVSKKTDYVVAGKTPGSKYAKAESLGVKIIGEAEFKNMAGVK